MSVEVNANNFAEEVLKAPGPVLVDFYGEHCLPCKLLRPILTQLSEEHENLKLCMFNTDREPRESNDELEKKFALLTHFQVMNLPTILLFLGGEVRASIVGLHSREEILHILSEKKISLHN